MDAESLYVIIVIALVIGANILYRILTRSANHLIDKASDAYRSKHNQAQQEATKSNKREKL